MINGRNLQVENEMGKQKVVLHLLTRLLSGGAEENTIGTCVGQAQLGYDVYLVYGDQVSPEMLKSIPDSVKTIQVPEMKHPVSPLADVKAVFALRKLYKSLKPDVIHTHQSKAGTLGRLAAFWLPNTIVIHSVHIAPFVNVSWKKKLVYVALEHLVAPVTDKFISVSKGMYTAYRSHNIGAKSSHHIVHSGMDIAKYSDAPFVDHLWDLLPVDLSLEKRPFVILMLASFEARKRQMEFLQSISPWLKENGDAIVCLAGEGPCAYAAEQWVIENGLQKQVIFMGHHSNPERLISMANVCVLASEREGLPRVVVQYIAGRRRVIMLDLPGIDELSTIYKGLVVVAENDFSGLVAEIAKCHQTAYQADQNPEVFESADLSSWNMDSMVSEIQKVYQLAEDKKALIA